MISHVHVQGQTFTARSRREKPLSKKGKEDFEIYANISSIILHKHLLLVAVSCPTLHQRLCFPSRPIYLLLPKGFRAQREVKEAVPRKKLIMTWFHEENEQFSVASHWCYIGHLR